MIVDRVQHGRVMLASELLANFRRRSRSELLREKHGDLAGKGDDLRVAADPQSLRAEAALWKTRAAATSNWTRNRQVAGGWSVHLPP
jgi:hypothetical protein